MTSGVAIMGLETCLGFFFARSTTTKAQQEQSSRNSFKGSCRSGCSSYRDGQSERMAVRIGLDVRVERAGAV
jgi:hypothetical protein